MSNGNSINTSKNYPFPNLMATPEIKKEKGYGLAFAKAMYGKYINEVYNSSLQTNKVLHQQTHHSQSTSED